MASEVLQEGAVLDAHRRIRSIAAAGNAHEAIREGRAAVERLLGAAESSSVNKTRREQLISHAELLMAEIASIQKKQNEPKKLKEPVSNRALPTKEELLLYRASKINGCVFPPWKGPPDSREFELSDGNELYTDDHELLLTPHQMKYLDGWKRANDALPPPSWPAGELPRSKPVMVVPLQSVDLVQDAVSDCSVVASLCAATARGGRGHTRLGPNIMFPYDYDDMSPKVSPNGKYVVRLNFNGCYRRVTIDDRLPVSKTKRVLHVIDRKNPSLLWPALVEKAYLKVRGGYDFPGSNSGTDLWILSGWIPEQIFLHSDDTVPSRLWVRIFNAFNYGDVLVTLGTGKMSSKTERELGLAGLHDYAVLDLKEVDDQKLLLVKNPWCEGTTFKGRLALSPIPSNSSVSLDETQSLRDALSAGSPQEQQMPPGTFWIDLNNVVHHFETMYLNWNPGLFRFRQDIHLQWDLSSSLTGGKGASLVDNPQAAIYSEAGGTVWVLLWRHFTSSIHENEPSAKTRTAAQWANLEGYIALHAYDTQGQRVYFEIESNPLERGRYIDSPQTLLKLTMPPRTTYTIVAAGEELEAAKHTFTISAFSREPVTLNPPKNKYIGCSEVKGTWASSTAGGGSHNSTYSLNPQYTLTLAVPGPISLLLQSSAPDLNVNVRVLYGRGKRITSINRKDVICDSGDYRRGTTQARKDDLPAGTYTVVVSTFEAGQTGSYTLRVDAAATPDLRLLPREGAGRLQLRLPAVSFAPGVNCMVAPVTPARHLRFYMLARFLRGPSTTAAAVASASASTPQAALADGAPVTTSRSPVRLALELGTGPGRSLLVATEAGEFSDRELIRTEDVHVEPNMGDSLWLAVERMSTGEAAEAYEVEIWLDGVDGSLEVGAWKASER